MSLLIRQIHPVFVGGVSGIDITRPLSRESVPPGITLSPPHTCTQGIIRDARDRRRRVAMTSAAVADLLP